MESIHEQPSLRIDSGGLAFKIRLDVTIREAVPSDTAVVTDFNLRLAEETEDLRLDRGIVSAGVEALLRDRSKGFYFVAEESGQVVGQVMITYEWSDWRNGNIWWLQSVYVHPDFRRKGVFRALFAHVRRLAFSRPDVWGLRLYMHSGNRRARSAYEELGMLRTHYEVFEMPGDGTAEPLKVRPRP